MLSRISCIFFVSLSCQKSISHSFNLVTSSCNTGFRTVSKQRHPRIKCSIVSSFSLHSKQVASVSVLYIRILLLCSIYDPVSNLSFTENLEMSLPVWQLTLNNGWVFPFSRFWNVRNVSPLYNGIKLVILSTHFLYTACIKIKKSRKMSRMFFLSMCDVKIFLTFTSPNMVLL